MEKNHAKLASKLANSEEADGIATGLGMISAIFEDAQEARSTEFGFLDNSLFIARKHASHPDPSVRDGVTRLLLAVGRMSASGREAANETADEIAMQPSVEARAVASQIFH
jgi:hypothetical protein